MKYIYFVAWRTLSKVGNVAVSASERLTTFEQIEQLERDLEDKMGITDLCITNFILLREERDYTEGEVEAQLEPYYSY